MPAAGVSPARDGGPHRPGPRLLPRLDHPRSCGEITAGLDDVIAGVGEILEKSAPGQRGRQRHQREPRRGRRPARGPAGQEGRHGRRPRPRRRPLPGSGRGRVPQLPRQRDDHAAAHRRGLHQGHAHARAARPRGADRHGQPGRARCCATSRAAASRRGCSIPTAARSARRTCRARRSSAPTPPSSTSSATTSGSRASGCPPADAKEHVLQTPAPFEYERATSVEGAIASLQRLGSEARIIAGGHSLLPMMKLRLANPEHLIDINDLAELVLHPRAGRRDPHRGADPARRPAEVRPAGRALPALPRRRERDRRPRRAQPRHDRRLAVPGRRRRGPLRRVLGGQGDGRHPRRRAASGWSAWRTSTSGPT